jgi:hypothetical protein
MMMAGRFLKAKGNGWRKSSSAILGRQFLAGWFAYHAAPMNFRALQAFRDHAANLWRRTLKRRSQRDGATWDRMRKIA